MGLEEGGTATYPAASVPRSPGDEGSTVAELLRLLSAGVPGAVLQALADGPVQTKVLTHRVRGYTPRTVYRYLPKLVELGVLRRDEGAGGPARIVNTLTEESGAELSELVSRFAKASMAQLPSGQLEAATWTSLGLLADLWEAGVVDELSRGSKSPTELARGLDSLSYHQVNRRASRFNASGFLCEQRRSRGQRRCYALTDKTRRTMGLVAGIGRWRHRHLTHGAEPGLTVVEIATLLRASLPLARMPRHPGKLIQLRVAPAGDGDDVDGQEVWFEVDVAGRPRCLQARPAAADCWAEGKPGSWIAVILDGQTPAEAGGDEGLVEDCLSGLYERLWTPSPF